MISLMLLGFAGLLIWYIYARIMENLNHFNKLGIKQSKPWPIVGDNWRIMLKIHSFCEFVEWAYSLHPKARYYGIYQMSTPTLVIRDPELIKTITIKDFDHFVDHRTFVDPEADPLWGGNLFMLKGQKWREMRATLSGSFTSSKMKSMFNLMNETAENFVEYFLKKNEDLIETELKDIYTRYTNDVIGTTAFGIKTDSLNEPDNVFYNMGKQITNFGGLLIKIKFFGYLMMPRVFKLLKVSFFDKKVSKYFTGIINETIEAREKHNIIRKDMINQLLDSRKGKKQEESEVNTDTGFATVEESNISNFKQNRSLTNEDITAQALIFFVAGFDSIATALCFGSYELATNKEVQDKLRDEIRETRNNTNGKLTYESLLKMKYLDMVVSEILRKWPIAVMSDRICTKPYTIEPVNPDEKPVHLKVGDLVMIPTQGIHRDSKYYPEPNKFNPERFSDENKTAIDPYTYLPFGSGPRNCIGSRFALLEVKALLYHLLLHFEIVPTNKTVIPIKLNKSSLNHGIEGGFWLGLKRLVS